MDTYIPKWIPDHWVVTICKSCGIVSASPKAGVCLGCLNKHIDGGAKPHYELPTCIRATGCRFMLMEYGQAGSDEFG